MDEKVVKDSQGLVKDLVNDCISRQAAIDAVKKNTFRLTFAEEQNCEGHLAWSANAVYSDVIEGALLELPSTQSEKRTEERTEKHACDCISRQAAIEALEKIDCSDGVGISSLKCDAVDDAVTAIKVLPSAQPERKQGKWIEANTHTYGIYECTACKAWTYIPHEPRNYSFCPRCGADMRGEKP